MQNITGRVQVGSFISPSFLFIITDTDVYICGGRIKAVATTDAKNAMKIMHATWQKI